MPLGKIIWVEFMRFDITSGKFNLCDLNGDYLLIQDRDRTGPVIGFYCGSALPSSLTSETNEIWLTFHTDGDRIGAGVGFKLSFTAIDPPIITTTTIATTRVPDVEEDWDQDSFSSQSLSWDEDYIFSISSEIEDDEMTTETVVPSTEGSSIQIDNILAILGIDNVAIGFNNRDRPAPVDKVIHASDTHDRPSTVLSSKPTPETSSSSTAPPVSTPGSSPFVIYDTTPSPSASISSESSPSVFPDPEPETSSQVVSGSESQSSPAVTSEPEPESSSPVVPGPEPESSSPVVPEPEPKSFSSVVPEHEPQSSSPTVPEPKPESSSPVVPEPEPESSSPVVSEPEPEMPAYPYNMTDPDAIHDACDKIDFSELTQLDAFIAMGELAVEMSHSLPTDWHMTAFSPHDSSDTVLAKNFILNFVLGANIILETIDNTTKLFEVQTEFTDCLQSYSFQLEYLLSGFPPLDTLHLGEGPIGAEFDLESEQDPYDFVGARSLDLFAEDTRNGHHQVHWCSSLMTSPRGNISSPNYPLPYPALTLCEWAIPVNPLKLLAIKFTDFNLGQEQNCTSSMDKVIVKVTTLGGPEMKDVYCGSFAPPVIISPPFSAMVTVKFISRGDVSHSGFQAVYTEVDHLQALDPASIEFPSLQGHPFYSDVSATIDLSSLQDNHECYLESTGTYGSVGLPEYPESYPLEVICKWNITVAADHLILLNMTRFATQGNITGDECLDSYPYAVISDLMDGQTVNEYVYCGLEGYFDMLSDANNVVVELHNIHGITELQGYYVAVNTSLLDNLPKEHQTPLQEVSACWNVFIEPSGNFSSPGYPGFYENNIVCTWTILADPLEYIGLKFIDFDVDNARSDCDIRYSYVRVTYFDEDGWIASDQLCGTDVALNVTISYSNQMVVYFYSELGVGTGFLAEYDAFNPDPLIDGAPVFSTTSDRIPDGIEDEYLSYGIDQWESEHEDVPCGDVLTSSGSVITSPGYPTSYGVNVWCSWIILAEPQQYVKLHFKSDFSVGTSSTDGTCFSSRSFVEVSYLDSSGQVTSLYLCGTGAPPVFTSYGNRMKVYFSSQQRGRVGFSAEIIFVDRDDQLDYTDTNEDEDDNNSLYYYHDSSVDLYESSEYELPPSDSIFCNKLNADCCYLLGENPYGTIYSPGYPNSYEQNKNCTWIIEGDENHIMSLVFTDFELDSVVESTEDCFESETHVRVVYFEKTVLTEHLYCGHSLPQIIISASNLIYMEFHSSGAENVTDRGFKAIYQVEPRDVDDADDHFTGDAYGELYPWLNIDEPSTSIGGATQSIGDDGVVGGTTVMDILIKAEPTSDGGDLDSQHEVDDEKDEEYSLTISEVKSDLEWDSVSYEWLSSDYEAIPTSHIDPSILSTVTTGPSTKSTQQTSPGITSVDGKTTNGVATEPSKSTSDNGDQMPSSSSSSSSLSNEDDNRVVTEIVKEDTTQVSENSASQEQTQPLLLTGEVVSTFFNTSVDPDGSGDSPIVIGGRFLDIPGIDIKRPSGDSPKRGRGKPGQDSAAMTTEEQTTADEASMSDVGLSGKGLPIPSEDGVMEFSPTDGGEYVPGGNDDRDGRVTPKGRGMCIFICLSWYIKFIFKDGQMNHGEQPSLKKKALED